MLKPIRTVRLKTVGLGIRFARGIMERAAVISGYDMSESELVFAMGAARERDDLISVLELLDEILDLIGRGFYRRSNALMVRMINNIGIIFRRGGFSREYYDTLEVYNKIFEAVEGKNESVDISAYHSEIQKQLSVLRLERTKQTVGQRSSLRFGATRAIATFKTVSERGTFTLNTLNARLLEIMARNPELQKMLKLDKSFMELSLKNIESLRHRTERAISIQRFLDALTAEQIKLLERFVVSEDLFSDIREKREDLDLKYMLENSSEKSLSEFFETLEQRIKEQRSLTLERSWFESAEGMKGFFVGAQRGEIETLIRELEKDHSHRSEVRVLSEALRIYEVETEKRGAEDGRLEELYGNAEIALKQRLGEDSFSEERFIAAIENSQELKRYFAEYAWENYRSLETEKRYAEYAYNTVSSEITKEGFAEFLINSGELRRIFSESVKNEFFNAPSDVAAAFAEYLVSTVRENDSDHYGAAMRSLAEKTENILYYSDSELSEKSSETFSLIYGAWNENSALLSEMYAEFTHSGSAHDEIMKLYSHLPKNALAVLSEFLEVAAQGNEECIRLSNEFKVLYNNITSVIVEPSEAVRDRAYTFYDALNDMPEDTLELLLPLAGASAQGESAALSKQDDPALVIAAAFAEYLSRTVRGDSFANYSESLHTLAERLDTVLRDERSDIRERSAEVLVLLRDHWRSDSRTLSKLYTRFIDFSEKNYDRSDGFDHEIDRVNTSFELLKKSEKLFEQSGFADNELQENVTELIFTRSGERGESTVIVEGDTSFGQIAEKALYRELAELQVLLPSVSDRFNRRVYNIAQSSGLVNKRIVTDKTFYNALKAFGGDADITENHIFSDSVSLTPAPNEYFFTWESGSVTQFSRAAANRLNIRANGFFKRRSSAALTLSERISDNYSAENQHTNYNTAVELFYTDEYFDNVGMGDTQVNYAIPAAASTASDDVSEKLGNICGAIDSINTEIAAIKQREEESSREFVTKIEHKIFERELKSSIERDIFLAGKRHGKF